MATPSHIQAVKSLNKSPSHLMILTSSWSYIMMYLQKYLIHNPSEVLKVTSKLRYYPKEYVRKFMAEAMSFVLRNAPDQQLERGIKKVIKEAVKKPYRESCVELLLYNIMKGCSSRLHSKAERVLQLLTSETIFHIGGGADQESRTTILAIIKSVFKRLCETMEPKELNLVWSCLYKKVHECVNTGNIMHLRRILSVLVSGVKVQKGQKVSGLEPLISWRVQFS
ncbi:U3 small nucleolar RNA-associated protein 20-like [Trifolium pratense]|uniref:U3 small nucleolar RNA-associated protein 20-like n=1 Tax=Trifolium pratense TaxID=57577 RepID=UPI001E68FFBE|nr:U3 small nucleolar RNA-associated protein 20-like [Trifolium pratense]